MQVKGTDGGGERISPFRSGDSVRSSGAARQEQQYIRKKESKTLGNVSYDHSSSGEGDSGNSEGDSGNSGGDSGYSGGDSGGGSRETTETKSGLSKKATSSSKDNKAAKAKAKEQAIREKQKEQEERARNKAAEEKAKRTENMTSKQLTTWQKATTQSLARLAKQLDRMYDFAVKLKTVTSTGQDENNLSYRYNDLATCTQVASKKLTEFRNAYDSNLTKYINNVKKSEDEVTEKARKSIDNFREVANKLAKL